MRLVEEIELYEVHRVEPSDWKRIKEDILRIENSAFETNIRQDEEDLRETFAYKKSICLVAIDKNNKKVVAYTMGAPLEWYTFLENFDEHYGNYDTFYIESISVLPEYQGRRIGKMLKRILIDEVRKEGYERITVHATNDVIKKINEQFGFRCIKYFKRWIDRRDAWYMEKLL